MASLNAFHRSFTSECNCLRCQVAFEQLIRHRKEKENEKTTFGHWDADAESTPPSR